MHDDTDLSNINPFGCVIQLIWLRASGGGVQWRAAHDAIDKICALRQAHLVPHFHKDTFQFLQNVNNKNVE